MRIIFSKDRPAQLDLLLTSLERNAEPEDTTIIYRSTAPAYAQGYQQVWKLHRDAGYVLMPELGTCFELFVRGALGHGDLTGDEFVTFLCDDDVLYGSMGAMWDVLKTDPEILAFSLRLGGNTSYCYPTMMESETPWPKRGLPGYWLAWPWAGLEPDWGYPGSVDGHVFRLADVQRMLTGKHFGNPTHLELALVAGCNELADERPLMACYPHSVLVGVPVNRVSEQSGVRHGGSLIYSAENLNASFLDGMRLSLDNTDWTGVNGAHTEIDLRWQVPVGSVA